MDWPRCLLLPRTQWQLRDGTCKDAVARPGAGAPGGERSPSALRGYLACRGLPAPSCALAPRARRPRPCPGRPGHPRTAAAAQPESGSGGHRVPRPRPRVSGPRSVPGPGTARRGSLDSLSRGAARAAAAAVPGSGHGDPGTEHPAEGGARAPRNPGMRRALGTLGRGDGKREPHFSNQGMEKTPALSLPA